MPLKRSCDNIDALYCLKCLHTVIYYFIKFFFFVQCGPVHVLVKIETRQDILDKIEIKSPLIFLLVLTWSGGSGQVHCIVGNSITHRELVFRCWVWVWCDLHRLRVSLERSISDGVASRAKLLITAWSSSQTLVFWSSLRESVLCRSSICGGAVLSRIPLCVCVEVGLIHSICRSAAAVTALLPTARSPCCTFPPLHNR